jgi:hypothetical protein
VSVKLAKLLTYAYANPSLPTARVRKDRLQPLQSARGMGLEMMDLDGMAEVLPSGGAGGYRTWRKAVSRGINHAQTPFCAYRAPHVASTSGVDLCSDKHRWLSDPLTDSSSAGPMARRASPQWLCPNATCGIAVVHGNHPISVGRKRSADFSCHRLTKTQQYKISRLAKDDAHELHRITWNDQYPLFEHLAYSLLEDPNRTSIPALNANVQIDICLV